MSIRINLGFLIICSLIYSCSPKENVSSLPSENEFALFFSLKNGNENPDTLTIQENWNSSDHPVRYLLVKSENQLKKEELKNIEKKYTIIKTPVKNVVCMSTSHLSFLRAIEETESVVAVSGARYVSDPKIKEGIENGSIADIGYESSVNYEMLFQLNPDVVFTYGISGENNQYIQKMRESGIIVISVGDYMEHHPLGKLEYLRFFGAFYNKINKADSIFNNVSNKYKAASALVTDTEHKPKVLLNAPWNDTWYIPGENNYMTHLVKDAGGEVLLSKKGDSHSYAHSLESVITAAYQADLWLNPNNYASLEELKNSSPLFNTFPPIKNGYVFNNNKRVTPGGGSDFWERGVLEPDIILNDLINIIHPESGNKKELVYYKPLN